MVLAPPARPSFWRSLLAGAIAGGFAAILTVPAQWTWHWSHGYVPTSALVALALVAVSPLLASVARRIAGEAGPRLVWQGSFALVPAFVYAIVEGFFEASRSPIFALGSLGGEDVAAGVALAFAGAWTGGTAVAWGIDRFRRTQMPYAPPAISRALPWLAVGVAVVLVVDASLLARSRPTSREHLATIEHLGTVPAVTLPKVPLVIRAGAYGSDGLYPHHIAVEHGFGFHITRFCSDVACRVFFARAPFPEAFERHKFPNAWFEVTAPDGAEVDVARDSRQGRIVVRVGNGPRRWFDESKLLEVFSAKELLGFMAPPGGMILTAGLGVVVAVALLRVRGKARRESELPFRAAHVENGFLRFDDGTPPVAAPTSLSSVAPRELLVVAVDGEARGAAFRDALAPVIEHVFVGSTSDLEALREERQAARRAAAFAAAVITSAPLLAAVGIARGW